jgi:hypothetical protein
MSDYNFDLGSYEDMAAVDFGNLDFGGMDLGNIDLGNIDFDSLNLDDIDLDGLNVGDIDLGNIDLGNINLGETNIGDIDLGSLADLGSFEDLAAVDDLNLADLTAAGDIDVNASLLTPDGIDESLDLGNESKVGSSGYYDEETGEFVYDENGGLAGPLDETSGTNTESMDGYTYDKKTGTWTTPSGDVYTPDKPPSNTSTTGDKITTKADGTDNDTDDDTKKDDEGATCAPGFHDDGTGFCVPDDDEEEVTDDDIDNDTKKDDTKKDITKPGGGTPPKTTKDGLGSLLPLLLALLAMNKGGGGGGGQSTVIPGLTATQRQTPYTQQQRAPGYRPGQGGISYFDQTQYAPKMASGGIARLLKGPGDGVSDSIPAVITNGMSRGGQPAKVARGEYIIDARTVAALGNGSTDAGAERLDKMRRKILRDDRKAGVGKDSKAYRHLMA